MWGKAGKLFSQFEWAILQGFKTYPISGKGKSSTQKYLGKKGIFPGG